MTGHAPTTAELTQGLPVTLEMPRAPAALSTTSRQVSSCNGAR